MEKRPNLKLVHVEIEGFQIVSPQSIFTLYEIIKETYLFSKDYYDKPVFVVWEIPHA